MPRRDDKTILRARDFWGALALIGAALFFLWHTTLIPMWGQNNAGVAGIHWYDSAAIVPLGVFAALLILSVWMLGIAIRDGGAAQALSAAGIGWSRAEVLRVAAIAVMLVAYIFALVPRVDFILASGLLITALIYGCHDGVLRRMGIAAAVVAAAGAYALIRHFPQPEWSRPHDDDWVALAAWGLLTVLTLRHARRSAVLRWTPAIAALVPFVLVSAMAFGFRQNIPNRGGLLFSQIEYHYYVTLKPLWSR